MEGPTTVTSMLEIELPRSRDAPRLARRWIADSFAADLEQEELERAKLLGSAPHARRRACTSSK